MDDCGFCKDTPIPTAVETTLLLKILPFASEPAYHWPSNQSSVRSSQATHTPQMQTSFSRVQFTWCCRCEMCCVRRCSQRRNVYTLREAEHVHAHTVELTIAQIEHHNEKHCQHDCIVNTLQGKSAVLTPRTAQPGEVWCCDDVVDISDDSEV